MISLCAPILDRPELLNQIAAQRKSGATIVLANGCFDLIHAGHIRYLAAAKALAEVLVVGVNSDEQTQKLKGDLRPVMTENDRAAIVAAIRSVDFVTIFTEPTVEELIRALRPDFHAKGTDYTPENVPERDVVIECGGKVVVVGDPKDHSSTELIVRMREVPKVKRE